MFGEQLLHAGTSIKRPKVIKISSDFQTLERAEMKRTNEPERRHLHQECANQEEPIRTRGESQAER